MKKNVTMRAAGFLLVGVMLSASIVSGTYAKYVTQDSAQDTARVAKFGVVATVSGDLFGKSYANEEDGNSIQTWSSSSETVSSSGANLASAVNVVAPGTKNDVGMTISVTGKPEVSTNLTIDDAKDDSDKTYVNTDILLGSGDYGVMVEYKGTATNDTVANYYKLDETVYKKAAAADLTSGTKLYQLKDIAEADAEYKPLKWKVGNTEYDNVAAVKAALTFTDTAVPNTDLSASKTITWEWPFSSDDDENDGLDTILGDMIADSDDDKYVVVKKNSSNYDTVSYADVDAGTGSANKVKVAYTGEEKPETMDDASVCAVLTVSFGANLTVTQVD